MASAMPPATISTIATIFMLFIRPPLSLSDAQVTMPERGVGGERFRVAAPNGTPALDNGMPIRDGDQAFDMLVDEQQRLPRVPQRSEAAPHFFAHQGCQAFGG